MNKVFNLFTNINSLPKKKEDDILSLELMGSMLSEIINDGKKTEMQRLIEIRLCLFRFGLYKKAAIKTASLK